MARGHRRIVASGEEGSALQALPLAALPARASRRCPSCVGSAFSRIGELIHQPRAPFAARFQPEFLRHLDQAWGVRPSRWSPSCRRLFITRRAMFLEPILSQEHVLEAARRLLRELADALARDAAGARVAAVAAVPS